MISRPAVTRDANHLHDLCCEVTLSSNSFLRPTSSTADSRLHLHWLNHLLVTSQPVESMPFLYPAITSTHSNQGDHATSAPAGTDLMLLTIPPALLHAISTMMHWTLTNSQFNETEHPKSMACRCLIVSLLDGLFATAIARWFQLQASNFSLDPSTNTQLLLHSPSSQESLTPTASSCPRVSIVYSINFPLLSSSNIPFTLFLP